MECVSCVTIDLCQKWKKPWLEFSIYCVPGLGQRLLTPVTVTSHRGIFTLGFSSFQSGNFYTRTHGIYLVITLSITEISWPCNILSICQDKNKVWKCNIWLSGILAFRSVCSVLCSLKDEVTPYRAGLLYIWGFFSDWNT